MSPESTETHLAPCKDLDALWEQLDRELERDPKGARVASLLGEYAQTATDWKPYALFGETGYARNLVGANERFELLLLCWNAGQESPIHNHESQRCWMTTLEGEMEELHFCFPEPDGGPLTPGSTKAFEPGKVAFITDEIALHRISPKNGAPGVTLHLYSKPIHKCRIYCERTGKVEWRHMSYHSIRGVLQPKA